MQDMLLDRTSFKQFAGLESLDQELDQKTLWKYRNRLSEWGRTDELMGVFKDPLAAHGYRLQTGTLIDSTLVQVPRQRNTRKENAAIKRGSIPPTGRTLSPRCVRRMLKPVGSERMVSLILASRTMLWLIGRQS